MSLVQSQENMRENSNNVKNISKRHTLYSVLAVEQPIPTIETHQKVTKQQIKKIRSENPPKIRIWKTYIRQLQKFPQSHHNYWKVETSRMVCLPLLGIRTDADMIIVMMTSVRCDHLVMIL